MERVQAPVETRKPWTAPIPKNKFALMYYKEKPAHNSSPLAVIKDEKSKVTQLLLAANCGRDIDKDVFSHESSLYPPSITQKGKMYHGSKSDIVPLLEAECHGKVERCPPVDSLVIDGPAMIHRLAPTTSLTIEEYISDKVVPCVKKSLESVQRVDAVWDTYQPDSLKKGVRDSRGSGIPRKVSMQMKIPTNFAGFLRVDSNKQDLFELIASELQQLVLPEGKSIHISFRDDVVCTPGAKNIL